MTSTQTHWPTRSLPRYGTARRPERLTTGAQCAVVAELLGVPLQPWQRHLLDVAGELVEVDGQLQHAYSVVSVSVGRRAGKSLATLVRLLTELLAGRRRFAYYSAQNGKAGADRFRDDWVPMVRAARPVLAQRMRPRLTNGSETIGVPSSGSYLRVFAPLPHALHGDAADVVMFDEAWAHSSSRGHDLEVAAYPLMATRPGAQVWVVSAAGDIDSEWWAEYLDSGRAAAAADLGSGHCHLEWTADGEDPDRFSDELCWAESHPGLRHPGNPAGVVQLDYLRAEYRRDPEQFKRSYLNITDRAGTTSAPIEVEAWQALRIGAPERSDLATITLGVDVAPDQASASVVACHHLGGGAMALEVIEHRPGYLWVTERVAQLADRWPVHTIALDASGQSPAAVLKRPLQAAGMHCSLIDLADAAAAAGDIVSATRAGLVRNVPHPALDAAVSAARRRMVGDGSWVWGRRDTVEDTSALIAGTYARWLHPDLHGTSPSLS